MTHSRRRARLAARLEAADLDALLVSDLVNVRYLSGFTGSNAALLVFAGDAPAVLATDSRYRTQAARQAPDLEVAIERQETDKLSRRQYLVLAIFLVTVGAWMTGGLTGLSTGTVGLLVVIVCFGSNLLSTRDFRNISWEILFMLGGGLCLGVALQSSGLTARIAVELPMDQGFWWIFGLLVLLAALMTTFMSNTATANLLVPIAVSLPHNQLLLAVAISIMCSGAMALPVSTPPNAVAFGSGLLRSVDMFRAGLWITLFALAATLLAGVFYLPLFH